MAQQVLLILAVDEVGPVAAFYERAFGWERVVDEAVYVELAMPGGQRFGVYQRAGFASNVGGRAPAAAPDGITATEVYVRVDDLDGTIEALRALGAPELGARAERPWGDEAAYFRDPAGNVVAVARELK